MKVKLVNKDLTELEFEVEADDALLGAAVITRNGRYYVYQSVNAPIMETLGQVRFVEVDQPYAVPF